MTTTQHHAIGTHVSYEDMANPLNRGTVTEVRVTQWGTEYLIRWNDGGEARSDLRQCGWKVGS